VSNASGYLTTADAARYAACCPESIRRAIRTRALKAVKVGRDWRTRREWVDGWLFAGIQGWSPDSEADAIVQPQPGKTVVN
jgi:excisionase family DNA binding protein